MELQADSPTIMYARATIRQNIEQWPERDRDYILWFLEYVNKRKYSRNYYDRWIQRLAEGPQKKNYLGGNVLNEIRVIYNLVDGTTN